jgi:hypothetical protein
MILKKFKFSSNPKFVFDNDKVPESYLLNL